MSGLSSRLECVLRPRGVEGADPIVVQVDDVDRRYRDAIKSGATPVSSPRDVGGAAGDGDSGVRREGVVLDASGNGVRVVIWSWAGS